MSSAPYSSRYVHLDQIKDQTGTYEGDYCTHEYIENNFFRIHSNRLPIFKMLVDVGPQP